MNTKNHILFLLSLTAIATSFSSCLSDNDNPDTNLREERKEIVLSGETRATAKKLENFYLHFTTDMTEYTLSPSTEKSKNVVVSPLSAAMVLGMTANGIIGKTQHNIIDYLGIDNISSLNALCKTLLTQLPEADKMAEIYIANSLWLNSAYKLSLTPEFSQVISDKYSGLTFSYDFGADNEKAKSAINSWCEESSNGMIRNYLDKLPRELLFILLNSTYFKAPWGEYIFSDTGTKQGLFNGVNGISEVMMMHGNIDMTYVAHNNEFEKFSIPFGNSAFYLEIILPGKDLSVAEACSKLTSENIEALEQFKEPCELTILMPKFKTECRPDISKMLKALYPEMLADSEFSMFEPNASGILQFKQATAINFDEKGVEAGTVSSADGSLSAPSYKPYIVTVDRPFFFFIREYSTEACILSGLIADI